MSAMHQQWLYCQCCVLSPTAVVISCLGSFVSSCLLGNVYLDSLLLQRFYGPIVKETLNQRPIFYLELFASISTDGEIYTCICMKVTEVKRILHHKKIFIMWLNIVRNSNWSIGREIEVWRGCKQLYYLVVSTWLTELHVSFRYPSLKINHLIS